MHKNLKKITLNIGLRAWVLAAKFLLIFFLAKYLDPASIGYFGLLAVALRYSMLFVSLDFYTYTTREILKYPIASRGHLLKCQGVLSFYLYLIFLPIMLLIFVNGYMPIQFIYWFFPLLILEHFNQEVYRILVALSQQVLASSLLFIRHASWAIIVVAVMSIHEQSRKLDFIFIPWIIAGITSAVVGWLKIYKLGMGGWKIQTDWSVIKKGMKVSGFLLISTFSIVGIRTFDRFWLEYLTSIEIVGAYVLFIGIASTLFTLMDAGVFSFVYPKLINLHNSHDSEEFNRLIKKFAIVCVVSCVIYGVVLITLLPMVLGWIDKPFYYKYDYIFYWLYASVVLHVISMIPHYGLYATRKDKQIVYSNMFGLLMFIVTAVITGSQFPVLAIPFALCIAFLCILVLKGLAFYCSSKVD